MRRSKLLIIAVILLGISPAVVSPAAAAGRLDLSLRIEGMDKPLYYNASMAMETGGGATLRDVIEAYNKADGVPAIAISADGARIVAVGSLQEKSFGSPLNDLWLVRLNGDRTAEALDRIALKSGDDVVIYYGDPSLIQYPDVDLTQMLSHGIVRFTSADETGDASGAVGVERNPVVGATVVWDGMTYTTDALGEIIIDSTGAGVRHSVSVERRYEGGLPTVLRYAPGAAVMVGYADVMPGDWFFGAVTFVAERHLMSGVTQLEFAPSSPVTKALFLTILGTLAGVDDDPSAETGFSDVVNDGWSPGYILWAVQNGIAVGSPDGTFGQYQALTREQIVLMLYRYAVLSGEDASAADDTLSGCADAVDVSPYALASMRWAVGRGIVAGQSGFIDPQGQATRAQVAVMLQKFIIEHTT
jgi:hypothetical protein